MAYFLLLSLLLHTQHSLSRAERHDVDTANFYTIPGIRQERHKIHQTANLDTQIEVKIAIAQRNIEQAEAELLRISHPDSLDFGKHWNLQQVVEWFAPDPIATKAVVSWLRESRTIPSYRGSQAYDGWVKFNSTIAEVEAMFQTKHHLYSDRAQSQTYLGCDSYRIPMHLRTYIDFIVLSTASNLITRKTNDTTHHTTNHLQPHGTEAVPNSIWKNTGTQLLPHCSSATTPTCLRSLYSLPNASMVSPHPNSTLGIVQLTAAHWLPSDLDIFFRQYADTMVGSRPVMRGINGGTWQDNFKGSIWNLEPDLDFEYTMSLTSRPAINYQIGGTNATTLTMAPTLNTLLAALDSSYCSALDSPLDHINETLSYESNHVGPDCGTLPQLPAVLSISYLWDEAEFPLAYLQRQCLEFLKLGLLGVTVIAASGDRGTAGWEENCRQRGDNAIFNPSSPSSCPYVTSVGATQLPPNSTAKVFEVPFFKNSSGVPNSSGGGFSNSFPAPVWQRPAVEEYLQQSQVARSNTKLFNHVGRGMPDIAASGRNYVTAVDGRWILVDGTSASTPTVASLVVLLNDIRLHAGKSTVGFLNPVLYTHPWSMNEVGEGVNFNCDKIAFDNGRGWNPVTGLGTPDFDRLAGIYQALP